MSTDSTMFADNCSVHGPLSPAELTAYGKCVHCVQEFDKRRQAALNIQFGAAAVAEGILGTAANSRQVGGSHYKNMEVQPWDVVDTWPFEQRIGYYRGGALKYLMRMGTKDENLQEIEKGLHYLEKLVEVLKLADAERRKEEEEAQQLASQANRV